MTAPGWPWNAVVFIGVLFVLDLLLWAWGTHLERRRRP
jgi:hypothetical protein